MTPFRDAEGDSWDLELTCGAAERIKLAFGADLLDPLGNAEEIERGSRNAKRCIESVWLILESQAQARDIDQKAFKQRLDGDAITGLREALNTEIANFIVATSPEDAIAVAAIRKSIAGAIQRERERTIEVMQSPAILNEIDEMLAAATTEEKVLEVMRDSAKRLGVASSA